jgi:hypothetical protein
MPDHCVAGTPVDLDGNGVSAVVITIIACEPAVGHRTINLYGLTLAESGYGVLDVPSSEGRNTPQSILFSFGATGRSLVLTLDNVAAEPTSPPSSGAALPVTGVTTRCDHGMER